MAIPVRPSKSATISLRLAFTGTRSHRATATSTIPSRAWAIRSGLGGELTVSGGLDRENKSPGASRATDNVIGLAPASPAFVCRGYGPRVVATIPVSPGVRRHPQFSTLWILGTSPFSPLGRWDQFPQGFPERFPCFVNLRRLGELDKSLFLGLALGPYFRPRLLCWHWRYQSFDR